MDDLRKSLNKLKQEEVPPTRLVRKNSQTLYHQIERKGIMTSECIGQVIRTHLPGNWELQQTIWDKDGLIDVSNTEITAVLRKVPSKLGNPKERLALKPFKGAGEMLYYPVPPYDPRKLFREADWPQVLDFWASGGTTKDERLVTAFKSCIIPFPKGNPMRYQPLNNHQIWVTNSGTGKSTFNLLYGNSPVQELTTAGLFGSNDRDYKMQIPGLLHGQGMFMIDEVSNLTVTNREDAPLLNLLLSYLEQGEVTRAFKKPILCQGTKTIILNSNPRDKASPLRAMHQFMRVIGGIDDKTRIGRRFGIMLFGNDYTTVDLSRDLPLPTLQFIQRTVKSALAKSQKTLYKLYRDNYPTITEPDKHIKKELSEIAKGIETFPEVGELLEGLALATAKMKTAGFKLFLAEHLDDIYHSRHKQLTKRWARVRGEYFEQIYELNLQSFRTVEHARITERDRDIFTMLLNEGYSQTDIARIMGISSAAVTKQMQKQRIKK
jgi:hypothetical protein